MKYVFLALVVILATSSCAGKKDEVAKAVEKDVTSEFAAKSVGRYEGPSGMLRFRENGEFSAELQLDVADMRYANGEKTVHFYVDCRVKLDGRYAAISKDGAKPVLRLTLTAHSTQTAKYQNRGDQRGEALEICDGFLSVLAQTPRDVAFSIVGSGEFSLAPRLFHVDLPTDWQNGRTLYGNVEWPNAVGALFAKSGKEADLTDYLLPIFERAERQERTDGLELKFNDLKQTMTVLDHRCGKLVTIPVRFVMRGSSIHVEAKDFDPFGWTLFNSPEAERYNGQRSPTNCGSSTNAVGAPLDWMKQLEKRQVFLKTHSWQHLLIVGEATHDAAQVAYYLKLAE